MNTGTLNGHALLVELIEYGSFFFFCSERNHVEGA